MKKYVLLIFISLIIGSFAFLGKANTAPNYEYSIYSPNNLSKIYNNFQNSPNDPILFIVDFSNSMNDSIQGRAKIDIARSTLAEILPKIPKNVKTGLRVYGHKSGFTYLQGCQASSLKVPLGLDNYQNIMNNLYASNATGWTPITYSLKQAINNDFAGVSGKKHIILLTDGGENCDESPCTYVINLMKTRDDVKIDVIAFDIQDGEANNQLRCTALMTSGKFLTADTEEDLSNSLFETVGISKDVKGSIVIPKE